MQGSPHVPLQVVDATSRQEGRRRLGGHVGVELLELDLLLGVGRREGLALEGRRLRRAAASRARPRLDLQEDDPRRVDFDRSDEDDAVVRHQLNIDGSLLLGLAWLAADLGPSEVDTAVVIVLQAESAGELLLAGADGLLDGGGGGLGRKEAADEEPPLHVEDWGAGEKT